MFGITSYAFYVPRNRLERAKIKAGWGTSQLPGEIAVAHYDEDALTLGAEAAQACVGDATSVDALFFASTSPPYAEKQMASVVATVCDLPRSTQTADFSGSVRAGTSALVAAANAVRAGARKEALVVAADCRLAAPESDLEGLLGDAAAAVGVGTENVIAEIVDMAFVSEEFTHLWRTDDQRFLQAFPGKFSNTFGFVNDIAEAAKEILTRQGVEAGAIAKLATYSPDARAAGDLCKRLGLDPKTQLVAPPVGQIGSAGCADALLAAGAALDQASPGDLILVAGYGEGADVVLLKATDRLPQGRPQGSWQAWVDHKALLPSYEKYLKHRRIIDVDAQGEAINNVLEFKELKQDIRLYGSCCGNCGEVQYPVARVCLKCHARDQMTDQKLNKRGRIFTLTVDHLIANVELPLPMVVVDLEDGGRLYLQMTDFDASEVEIGNEVVLTYRRLHEGGGKHNYYWKARPAR